SSLAPQLHALLADQRRRWLQGERVLVEAYLDEQVALGADPETVLCLIQNEVRLRAAQGEAVTLEEYLARFPSPALAGQLPEMIALEQAVADSDLFRSIELPEPLPPTPTKPERPFPVIPGFTILREIGHGGMGVVYEAVQEALGRHVALKILRLASLS